MRLSKSFGKTLRDAPADAEMISHQLLIRANFVRPLSAGIYTFMPLGFRVLRNIWHILVDEMDAIGGQEMWMPNLHPAAFWQATGRWESMDVLMKLKGGGGREYAMSPTHEEVVVDLALREINSYRDLPQVVYHIGKKFRDESRARGGLLRLREFVMKDAYSLDVDEAALDIFYPKIIQAYHNIFQRCAVPVQAIHADVGAMGGKTSHEFVVPHEQGEDTFIACSSCDYAANVEAAEFVRQGEKPPALDPLQKIATPHCKTIAAVAEFTGVPTSQTIKAVFYWWTKWGQDEADGRLVFVLLRGDLDVSEVKVANALGGGELRPADDVQINDLGAVPGYASAVGLKVAADLEAPGVIVIADPSIESGGNFVIGANEEGYHFQGANFPRDFMISLMSDIAQAASGHSCPVCGAVLQAQRAIEAGHCFKLGTRYSEAVGAAYLDVNGRPQPIFMGSYGIGLDRLMAIIVEKHHDKDGIIWPDALAPYQVHMLHIGKDQKVIETAEEIYQQLRQDSIQVLYDDRDLGAGVKFKDADLIGIPWRITIGSRGLAQGLVEVKRRDAGEREQIALDQLAGFLSSKINKN